MKKVGLLGGSFDPPHKGHIYISLEAKKVFCLDEVWWIVSPQNPLKINKPASYEERLKNCHKLVKNFPINIKEYEKKINSPYSYKTIKYLKNKYDSIKFFWLMGADNLVGFNKWQNWQEIFNEVSVVVFKRHGYNSNALKSITNKKFLNYRININSLKNFTFQKLPVWHIVENKEVRISSTQIRNQRNQLRKG
ncbi:MAG: putative nicotinate-nucleotide adenylyltransferase [Alphaproteobacteria bacterium MarineAlpha5_Bin11]|nr:nicotinate (nicotinamide) nucleotide adenylyltransferase [Pelagibacteraceae bacterium]PPR45007.1 MAG: putative nicotinate-nucleotide adenylyltransferase [Alphaproteobacteria bacterium MarineAlpha5_Bin11]PPR51413.1 MAG: putative nicotinate-nucleotide adenylyltransferase [Alphaproteobacteria bacterium MarineAlpha5_Bin10]|tara:strand:- start:1558 stop:2136 length:579 start_codon:yes stop_codon:yes gene_type:complete